MSADFLTREQQSSYGKYPENLSQNQLGKYFYLDDNDKALIFICRRKYNQLGYALQLATVRFIGTFLSNPIRVPIIVKRYIAEQLAIDDYSDLAHYMERKATRSNHVKEIKVLYGYQNFDGRLHFRLTRWLYSQAWFGTERPSMLFERATTWLVERKILLPGATVLTRLILQARDRVSKRLWLKIERIVPEKLKEQLEELLNVPENARYSVLDQLKFGPRRMSSNALISALNRYNTIKAMGVNTLNFSKIPKNKLIHLARYVTTSWAPAYCKNAKKQTYCRVNGLYLCLRDKSIG